LSKISAEEIGFDTVIPTNIVDTSKISSSRITQQSVMERLLNNKGKMLASNYPSDARGGVSFKSKKVIQDMFSSTRVKQDDK